MAGISWGDVTSFASGLSVVAPGAQMMILAHVNSVLAVDLFGGEASTKTHMLRVMLAAHFGQLEVTKGGTKATGQVVSETIAADSISLRYADIQGGMNAQALRQTPYGSNYLDMIQSSAARVGFVP